MLSGMLLHVVAAAGEIDLAAHARAGLEVVRRSFKVVHDASVFEVGDFADFVTDRVGGDDARVEDLASAGGVEGGAVEDDCRALGLWEFFDFGFEVVEEGIVVVKAVGHGERSISPQRGRRAKGTF